MFHTAAYSNAKLGLDAQPGQNDNPATGFGEQHWLTPSGNLPPAQKSCGGVEMFNNSSVMALHWDLVKGKILIKAVKISACRETIFDISGEITKERRNYAQKELTESWKILGAQAS